MTEPTYRNIEDMPFVLNVDQVSEILGISRKVAYKLVKKEKLAIRVGEKRLLVPRDRLYAYLNKRDILFSENG